MEYKVKEQISSLVYADICAIAQSDAAWEKMQGATVLITGAGGFIPYYLILSLLDRNDRFASKVRVIGLVRNAKRAEEKFGALLEREDFSLLNQDVCTEIAIPEKADYVIHAASQASAWHFENDPVGTINANLMGTGNVLEYARKAESKGVLFLSSLKVYGKVQDGSLALKEESVGYLDHTSYRNCYATGKRAAETLCACYHKQHGISVKIARPSYIYGPASMDDDRVWAQFLANVVLGQDILLKSNGAAYRSFCYVSDAASALFKILLEGEDVTPYNIADRNSNVTIRNFARAATEVFPERSLSLIFSNPEDEAEPAASHFSATPEILDSAKLEGLGWKAQVDLKEGIRRSVQVLEEGRL